MAEEENYDEEEDIVEALQKEVEMWKKKYKSLELKKKDADLSLNKVKTEINSLRSVDRLWKESAKNVYNCMNEAKSKFDAQVDEVIDGLSDVSKVGERITRKVPLLQSVKDVIEHLQKRTASQAEQIINLNGKVRSLQIEIEEKTLKIERLSQGIEEEVERLTKPMREKLANSMVLVMKEKAARAQERRELADLWPTDRMMPSLLMKYRALTDEERKRRLQIVMEQDASRALALEVRANVVESKMWEVKYDDYGRKFYEHKQTAETSWDPPEIMKYKPPPGRDEMGNVTTNDQNDLNNWKLMTDNRGKVYYQHKTTDEITYIPPNAYKSIPKGKTRYEIVGEAAQVVLKFIQEKITKHIETTKKLKEELENPLTPEQRRKKEKEDQEKEEDEQEALLQDPVAAEKKRLEKLKEEEAEKEGEPIDLAEYQYDIETVERLASTLSEEGMKTLAAAEKDPEAARLERRAYLEESNVRSFDKDYYIGPTLLETDVSVMKSEALRGVVEELADKEETLENHLERVRTNIKDFSFVLMERLQEENLVKTAKLKEELAAREAEQKALRKSFIIEQRKIEREQSELQEKALENDGLIEEEGVEEGGSKNGSLSRSASRRLSEDQLGNEENQEVTDADVEDAVERLGAVTNEGKDKIIDPDGEPGDEEVEEEEEEQGSETETMLVDYGMILFGDIQLNPTEPDVPLDMVELTKNLVNFAFFCGFANLHPEESMMDSNASYSLMLDHRRALKAMEHVELDDGFFSGTFFLNISKEMLDQIKESTQKRYESFTGTLRMGPLHPEKLEYESILGGKFERNSQLPYTKETKGSTSILTQRHQAWKNRQLMADIFRRQIQLDAVRNAYKHRFEAFRGVAKMNDQEKKDSISVRTTFRLDDTFLGIPMVKLVVRHIKYEPKVLPTSILDSQYYVQLTVGSWTMKTGKIHPGPQPLQWEGEMPEDLAAAIDRMAEEETVSWESIYSVDKSLIPSSGGALTELDELDESNGEGLTEVRTATAPTQGDDEGGNDDDTAEGSIGTINRPSGLVPVNDMQLCDCVVELLDNRPKEPEEYFVGKTAFSVDNLMDIKIGKDTAIKLKLKNRDDKTIGTITVILCADFAKETAENIEGFLQDPHQLRRVEQLAPKENGNLTIPGNTHTGSKITLEQQGSKRRLSEADKSSEEEFKNNPVAKAFSQLTGELRGDGVQFTSLLTGDVTVQDIEKSSGGTTPNDMRMPLPNFHNASLFLEKKTNKHRWEVDGIMKEINTGYVKLTEMLQRKYDNVIKNLAEAQKKVRKVSDTLQDLQKEVLRIKHSVEGYREPHPQPKEPVFEEFTPVPHVPKLPLSGGLDARGKKRKALPSAELKKVMEQVESGALDGAEDWPFPEKNWPSTNQHQKLTKVIQARNAVLDAKRDQEKKLRAKLLEVHEAETEKWEAMERKRNNDLEKAKKNSRRVNVRYDSMSSKLQRMEEDMKALEMDATSIRDLKTLHEKTKDRFKLLRFRQGLEFDRQSEYLQNSKKRLLFALNARRFAMELPRSASDEIQFQKLSLQAEEALHILKFEIFECKQQLVMEGVQLRTLFKEELQCCESELARVRISQEVVAQRECFDQILDKYKVEVLHLMSDMEKLRLQETDKDMEGIETVDDLGERYIPTKFWQSPDIHKCQKLIDICLAKINITDGLGFSTANSQRVLVEVMSAKWNSEFFSARDSWSVGSDYERAQQLLQDTLGWATHERRKLQEQHERREKEQNDLQLQLSAVKHQQQLALVTHETEASTISHTATQVIDVMRKYLKDYREESEAKILTLDQSIIEISRECQKVREQVLAQEAIYDDKVKVLWAFIHTLQTTVQHMTAKMEMVEEEKEKIVIQSKLVADKMRHQLRVERKYASNLLFIIQSQRGTVKYLQEVIKKLTTEAKKYVNQQQLEKSHLRREIWEQVFTFTRLSTDVDALFEYFVARLANLAGSRRSLNEALSHNGAALVLAALCKSPRPNIRKDAARAMGGMGWDGFVETRVLLWDCVTYWKRYKMQVLEREAQEFKEGLDRFNESGNFEAILNIKGEVEEFVPSGNISLRTLIKQRRQWALRAARRREGPNVANQRQLNVKDGVIPSLLEMSLKDGAVDWEIARNAALAISIASYEQQNHYDITHNQMCVDMIISMCSREDAEVQTHAALTIANLCNKDEESQKLFGDTGAVEALVKMCASPIVDVLEAATAALANLTCYCDVNCERVLNCDGVKEMLRIITLPFSENLLDLDQNEEVQANAVEMLANTSRFNISASVNFFDEEVIDCLVVLCASENKSLRKNVPLILGNIAQGEKCRHEIGLRGGVEALFLVLEDVDTTIQANGLWALCNLMWHPTNQERAGRFTKDVVAFFESSYEPVRTQAVTLIANILYYNTPNRMRFLETEGAMEAILNFATVRVDVPVVESSLRALLSLSYVDTVALFLGNEANAIPLFIGYLYEPYYSKDSMRYSLEIICNLCLHQDNRQLIFDNGGIDACVNLHADVDPHVREVSTQVVDYLEDITPAEVMAKTRANIGLERMVKLATSDDPMVRTVAAQAIGEEVWADPKKQQRAQEIGGVDVLLGILKNNASEPVESLLPALWSLRNLMHNRPDAQVQFGYRDGIVVTAEILRGAVAGVFSPQTEQMMEAALTCLAAACVGEERNSRRLLIMGLDVVMEIADRNVPRLEDKSFMHRDEIRAAMKAEGVSAVAKSLMLTLDPYNYVVCQNCHRRQEVHGVCCCYCGYRLLTDIDMSDEQVARTLGGGNSVGNILKQSNKGVAGVAYRLRKLAVENKTTKIAFSETMPPGGVRTSASEKQLGPVKTPKIPSHAATAPANMKPRELPKLQGMPQGNSPVKSVKSKTMNRLPSR